MTNQHTIRLFLLPFLVLILSACGGDETSQSNIVTMSGYSEPASDSVTAAPQATMQQTAEITGAEILNGVLEVQGATISDLQKNVISARLQQMINAGTDSNLQIALVLAANPQIRNTVTEGNISLALANVVGEVKSGSGNGGGDTSVGMGTLAINEVHNLSIGAYATDRYSFIPSVTGTYTISIANAQSDLSWMLSRSTNWDDEEIYFCDNFLDASNEICTPDEVLIAGQEYYLFIDEWDNVSGTYNLLISPTQNGGDKGQLAINKSYGLEIEAYATDRYSFIPSETGTYTISITNAQSDLSWTLSRSPNTNDKEIYFCDNYLDASNEVCTPDEVLIAGQEYYLYVDEWDNIGGTYNLLIVLSPSISDPCFDKNIIQPEYSIGTSLELFKLSDGTLWKVESVLNHMLGNWSNVKICPSRGEVVINDRTLPVSQITNFIESRIDGTFNGWSGSTSYALTNGQIWQQATYKYEYAYKIRPEVILYQDGIYYMMMVDWDDPVRVVRIQ